MKRNDKLRLMPHQEAAVTWLSRHPRSGLFDDPGLGKTASVIMAHENLRLHRMLVVCPSVVVENWKREVEQWTGRSVQILRAGKDRPRIDAETVIMSHALLLNPGLCRELVGFDSVVLDEAHLLRNPNAKRTAAFYLGAGAVCRRPAYCWLLTGTPMANNPVDVWTALAGVAPGRLRTDAGKLLTYGQFRDRFCITRPTGFGSKVQVIGVQNVDELRKRLAGFYLRRGKDTLDLPPVRHTTVVVSLDEVPAEFRALAAMEDRFAGIDDPDDLLAALQADSASFAEWRRLCGLAKIGPAADLIDGDLQGGVSKVVVAAHHLDVIEGLRARLSDYNPRTITGALSAVERQEAVDAFQNDPTVRVIVLQLQAGGVGITLHAASHVVMVESSFVPGDNQQVADRVHRIGQRSSVLVRHVALAGSVDTVVADVLARKSAMISQAL